MGSLVAALASYLDARANNGQWLLRMEDLDPPREQAGAGDLILRQLDTLGLYWDGSVLYQSQRHEAYRLALARLEELGLTYYCTCSRQQLKPFHGKYPGFCRERKTLLPNAAIRCLVDSAEPLTFNDLFQGKQIMRADSDGDFVILRRDGLFAYQLAVVVDDAFQEITHVIRGIDLLDSTPKQQYLQRKLGFIEPVYGHLPVLTDIQGDKLSKQQGAQSISTDNPSETLLKAFSYLQLPDDFEGSTPEVPELLEWAVANWKPDRLTGRRTVMFNSENEC
jgi:glutamyl-Q tRNA(Asp) synthetase